MAPPPKDDDPWERKGSSVFETNPSGEFATGEFAAVALGREEACDECRRAFSDDPILCPGCRAIRPPDGWKRVIDIPDAWLGREIGGRYILTQRLGQGSAGAVYRATGSRSRETLAAKLIDFSAKEFTRDLRDVTDRVKREVEILARVRSPHVVKFRDVLELPGPTVAIITDYIDGKTLGELVDEDEEFEQSRAVELIRQVAIGMSEVHRLGAVHRDLKPDNILIQQLHPGDEFAYIIDFGIARKRSEIRQTQGFIGTPLYASPEQARGEDVDALSDIYSLGALLYMLLSGNPPFNRGSSSAVLTDHAYKEVPSLRDSQTDRDFSPELVDLVGSMLAKDPEDRPPSMDVVADRLSRLVWDLGEEEDRSPEVEGADPFDELYRDTDVSVLHLGRTARLEKEGFSEEPSKLTGLASETWTVLPGLSFDLAGDGAMAYVDRRNRLRLRENYADGRARTVWHPTVRISALRLMDDYVVCGHTDGTVSFVNRSSGILEALYRDRRLAPVSALAEADDGSITVAGSSSGRLRYGRAPSPDNAWRQLPSGPPVTALAVDRGMPAIAVGRSDGTTTLYVQAHDHWEQELVLDHGYSPTLLRFSEDGYLLAAYTTEDVLLVYNTSSGQQINRREICPMEAGLVFHDGRGFSCSEECSRSDSSSRRCVFLPKQEVL